MVELVFVVVDDVHVRHADVIKDHVGIIRNMEKDKSLAGTDIPILDALTNHIRKELCNNGGGERLRCELKAHFIFIDHVSPQLDLRRQPLSDFVTAKLMRCLVLDCRRGNVCAV